MPLRRGETGRLIPTSPALHYHIHSHFIKLLLLQLSWQPLFLHCHSAVCQLMNKCSRDSDDMEAFNKYDERLLEDLAVYCGLALQYAQAVQITEERRASIEVTQEVGKLPSLSQSQGNMFAKVKTLYVHSSPCRFLPTTLPQPNRKSWRCR